MWEQVYRGDVCDAHFLRFLMLKYNFTDVVHLAAQAGVRYSLEDPQAYVSANYECFISLLDVLLEFPVCMLCDVCPVSLLLCNCSLGTSGVCIIV